MALLPLWWAYRKAARWQYSILLVTLVTFGLVSVQQDEPTTAFYQKESRLPTVSTNCSAWSQTELVDALPGPEVYHQLAAEFDKGSLSTHCGRLWFPGRQPLCLDSDLLPGPGPCLVYSFSVNSSLTMEDALARRSCEVHLFDATTAPLRPQRLPHGVRHHQISLHGSTRPHRLPDGRKVALMTLDEVTAVLGHQDRDVHYLRLDAEESEWDALQQQLTSTAAALRRVRQLQVTFHLARPRGMFGGDPERRPQLTEENARRCLRTIKALQAAGFRLAHTRPTGAFPDTGVAHTYETLWIRWEEV